MSMQKKESCPKEEKSIGECHRKRHNYQIAMIHLGCSFADTSCLLVPETNRNNGTRTSHRIEEGARSSCIAEAALR